MDTRSHILLLFHPPLSFSLSLLRFRSWKALAVFNFHFIISTLRLLPVLICCFPADLFTRASNRTDAAINHGSETGIISIPSQSLQRQGQASDPGSKYFPKAY
ncbi:hypothetical protein ILYODFUR_024696 [Ilyodon furcidens]|uniref:Uncharacterized protein n=1 Tax=Ilyodon furcidens TaxID=33524 RepID=A0ABV0UW43_9TELE